MDVKAAQVAMFVAVGAAATVVHAGVALAAHKLGGVDPLWANAIAFTIAWTCSYIGNHTLTFGGTSDPKRSGPRFFATSLAAFGLNQAIVFVGTTWLGAPFWLSLVVVVTAVPVFSFVLASAWAFKVDEAAPPEGSQRPGHTG